MNRMERREILMGRGLGGRWWTETRHNVLQSWIVFVFVLFFCEREGIMLPESLTFLTSCFWLEDYSIS